jgi:hypothetical protein
MTKQDIKTLAVLMVRHEHDDDSCWVCKHIKQQLKTIDVDEYEQVIEMYEYLGNSLCSYYGMVNHI